MVAFIAFLLFVLVAYLTMFALAFAEHLWRASPDELRWRLGRGARPQLRVGPQRLYIEAAFSDRQRNH